jgi:hypothetical protein
MAFKENAKSQAQVLLTAFQAGRKITPLEALRDFGIGRLAARVYELKQRGYDIKDETVAVGDGKHVSQYYMKGADREKAWFCATCSEAVVPSQSSVSDRYAIAACLTCRKKGVAVWR